MMVAALIPAMLLQVLQDLEVQWPRLSALSAATLEGNDVITSAANMPEEFVSVPDPSDDGSVIQFCVSQSSQAAAASLQAPSGRIASMGISHGSCADGCQRLWRPCSGPLQTALVSQTAGLVQEISHKPSPVLLPPVKRPIAVSVQPLKMLGSLLAGSVGSNVRHADDHSSMDGQSAARESRRLGGYTFCGQPTKVACWLSDLCQHLPGVPVSDSQMWAMGSGSHPYSAVRLAGLQQLGM